MALSEAGLEQLKSVPEVGAFLEGKEPTHENILRALRYEPHDKRFAVEPSIFDGFGPLNSDTRSNRSLILMLGTEQQDAERAIERPDVTPARKYRRPPRERIQDIHNIFSALKEDPWLMDAALRMDISSPFSNPELWNVIQRLFQRSSLREPFANVFGSLDDAFGYLEALKPAPQLLLATLLTPVKYSDSVRENYRTDSNTFMEAIAGGEDDPSIRIPRLMRLFSECPDVLTAVVKGSPSVTVMLQNKADKVAAIIREPKQWGERETAHAKKLASSYKEAGGVYMDGLCAVPAALVAELAKPAPGFKELTLFDELDPEQARQYLPIIKRAPQKDIAALLIGPVYKDAAAVLDDSTKSYDDFMAVIRKGLKTPPRTLISRAVGKSQSVLPGNTKLLVSGDKEGDQMIEAAALAVMERYFPTLASDPKSLLEHKEVKARPRPNKRSPKEMFDFIRTLKTAKDIIGVGDSGLWHESYHFGYFLTHSKGGWSTIADDIVATRHNANDVKDTVNTFVTYVLLPAIVEKMQHKGIVGSDKAVKALGEINGVMRLKAMEVLFGERGLPATLSLSRRFHEREHYVKDEVRDWPSQGIWHSLFGVPEIPVTSGPCKGWKFINLTESAELEREGRKDVMDHCVGGYSDQCQRAEAHIFSMRDASGTRRSTLTLMIMDKAQAEKSKITPEWVIEIPESKKVIFRRENGGFHNKRFAPSEPEERVIGWLKDEVESGRLKFDLKRPLGRDYSKGAREGADTSLAANPLLDRIGFNPTHDNRQRAFEVFADRHNNALEVGKGKHLVPEKFRQMDVDDFLKQTHILDEAIIILGTKGIDIGGYRELLRQRYPG